MSCCRIVLGCDPSPLEAALNSLSEIAELSPEIVQRFFCRLDSASQLVRIDSDDVLASGASNLRVVLQPSDLFVEFLSAAGAGECHGV